MSLFDSKIQIYTYINEFIDEVFKHQIDENETNEMNIDHVAP